MMNDLTRRLVDVVAQKVDRGVGETAKRRAGYCLLDWTTATIAGWSDASAQPVRALVGQEIQSGSIPMIGTGGVLCARQAALLSGTACHALDVDDVHLRSRVHPSCAVYAAITAMGGAVRSTGAEIVQSFCAGVEFQSRLGVLMGNAHYRLGWHNTATLGAFGATMAAARLLRLEPEATCDAMATTATCTAGLRVSFGSMAKPLHAGRAAECGVMSALLASEGFAGAKEALAGERGFVRMMSDDTDIDGALDPHARLAVDDIIFKYHASCYGTHAPIEAALKLAERVERQALESAHVEIAIEPQYMNVCDIELPRDAIEAKFSVRHCVALALTGADTIAGGGFEPAMLENPAIRGLRERSQVSGDTGLARANARVAVTLADGRRLEQGFDASKAELDLAREEARLSEKLHALCHGTLTSAQMATLKASAFGLADGSGLADYLSVFEPG